MLDLPRVEVAWPLLFSLYFYTNLGLDVCFQESREKEERKMLIS